MFLHLLLFFFLSPSTRKFDNFLLLQNLLLQQRNTYFSSYIATLHAHSYFLLIKIYFSTTTTTLFIQNLDNIFLLFVENLLSTKKIFYLGLPSLSSPLTLSQLALSLFLTSLMLWLRLQRNFVTIMQFCTYFAIL